jgi:quercetin dioxygenase-like cupin family protein
MNIVHVDELDRIEMPDGFVWRPVRMHFGIKAFGVNAYTTTGAGSQVIESHTESQLGHEELYLVLRGRARFTVEDDSFELGPGQLVFLRDPALRRGAVALDDDTAVLAVGGKPGEQFQPSAWELGFRASRMDPKEAVAYVEEHMGEYPDSAATHYNLACFRALAGDKEGALAEAERAQEMDPESFARWAADDSDLDSIRDDPRFAELLTPRS